MAKKTNQVPVKSKKLSVLIVDDAQNMRRTIRNMLASFGYKNVIEADDGDSALIRLKKEPVGFIICDWIMPRMPGVELLRALKENAKWRYLPFLMVTGEITEAQIAKAAEEEVDGYIIKPFVTRTLQEKFDNILNKVKKPDEFEAAMQAGYRYKDKGQLKKALNEFKKARSLKLKSARVIYAIAKIYDELGQDKKAEEWYREAITTNPRYLKAQQGIGDFYMRTGNEETAIKFFEHAATISPNNSQRQLAMSQIYIKDGNNEKAAEAINMAVIHDPKNAKIQADAGELYLKCGMAEKAAETFRNSLEINENVHVYNRLGIALRRKKRYKEAIETYRKALKVEPDNEVVFYNLGRALVDDHQPDAALEAFKKGVELDSNFEECKAMLKKVELSLAFESR